MFRSLASTRSAAARVARTQFTSIPRRTFIRPTASLQADLVQDLYLKELKNYKQPAAAANDHQGHVQEFKAPAAPKSPEEDISKDLSAYEKQSVEVEGQAAPGETKAVEEDWFEEEPEEQASGSAH